MARYDVYLLLHIVCVIAWLGAGLMLTIQAFRAMRARDNATIERILGDAEWLSTRLFIPASLLVLVFGTLMVVDGPWEFDQLWIVLGLLGFAATFSIGTMITRPRSNRIHALMQRGGGMTPTAAAEAERLLIIARADLVVLYLVVAVMVIKPTGADVAVLAAMAAILVGAVGWVVMGVRAVEVPPEAEAAGGPLIQPSGGGGMTISNP